MISIARPLLGEEEQVAVAKVIESGLIASGKEVHSFEGEFAEYCGVKHAIAASSGTTALELALRGVGISPGDKVVTTSYSFIATANAIIYCGGIPVFVDIEDKSFNLIPEQVENELKKDASIKAILIVHLFGQPCDMNKILGIAKKYNVKLIEDCAQAHGAEIAGRRVGSFGDAAAFSFYPTKNMTTGEGGMVVTNSDRIADKVKMYINHGMRTRYYHEVIGYNYRMTNIAAAIGLCQLKKLESFNAARRKNAAFYFEKINNDKLILPENVEGHVYHQFTIRVLENKRDELVKLLEEKGIGYGIFYPLSMPEQSCYREYHFKQEYENTDLIKTQVLSIPIHPALTREELRYVVDALNLF